MATDNEPAKLLLPYLQRADELQKHEPLVAYYCRLYAMERGLKIPQSDRTKTTNALLVSLMKQLEKDKKSLKLGPDDQLHLEGFALSVFVKADKQDRAGRADLSTAKTFYAASIFFEILDQFGELQPDLEQKQKYAVWKAADIRKALKEGRKPLPGPPGGDDALQIPSQTSSGEYDLELSRGDFAARPDLSRVDPIAKTAPDSDSFPHVCDQGSVQPSTSSPPQPSISTPMPMPPPAPGISPPPNYAIDKFSSDNPHQQPSPHNSQHSIYQQRYIHQPHPQEPQHLPHQYPQEPQHLPHQYPQEPQDLPHQYPQEPQHLPHQYPQEPLHLPHQYPQEPQHLPGQYPSQDALPLSYPNFQSYPSFTDSSLPVAPSHYPSRSSYINSAPSNAAAVASTPEHNPSSRNVSVPEASSPITQENKYDSSYQPPPDKIAEAHKAARFAVGALAFDDVSVAVDYLKKSLELLTNPSAGH